MSSTSVEIGHHDAPNLFLVELLVSPKGELYPSRREHRLLRYPVEIRGGIGLWELAAHMSERPDEFRRGSERRGCISSEHPGDRRVVDAGQRRELSLAHTALTQLSTEPDIEHDRASPASAGPSKFDCDGYAGRGPVRGSQSDHEPYPCCRGVQWGGMDLYDLAHGSLCYGAADGGARRRGG